MKAVYHNIKIGASFKFVKIVYVLEGHRAPNIFFNSLMNVRKFQYDIVIESHT